MRNLNSQASSTQLNSTSGLPLDVQDLLDELERRSAFECEAALIGWQGPSAARARLIDEVEARYRRRKAGLMRRLAHPLER